ncbi:hypothetical protein B0H13DRAFT_2230986 [Mycena leptocephala]|nr:hypothetical protein B0H13DRAFT_2230986 [Mycena leptocephala]
MSSFAPKTGCPMCGIVAKASHVPPNSPRSPAFPAGSTEPELLWRDDNFTAYREKANPVSSKGHIIVTFNLHVPSITLSCSSTDLPLLVNIRNLATWLLNSMLTPSSPLATTPVSTSVPLYRPNPQFRIGFITPPFWDRKIPVTDHLHAHAYIGSGDLMGWVRGLAYGPLAWYPIDDLIAEIRESVTNNRIKSGGTADGIETSEPGLASVEGDLEDGQGTPTALTPRSAMTPSIPTLRV